MDATFPSIFPTRCYIYADCYTRDLYAMEYGAMTLRLTCQNGMSGSAYKGNNLLNPRYSSRMEYGFPCLHHVYHQIHHTLADCTSAHTFLLHSSEYWKRVISMGEWVGMGRFRLGQIATNPTSRSSRRDDYRWRKVPLLKPPTKSTTPKDHTPWNFPGIFCTRSTEKSFR